MDGHDAEELGPDVVELIERVDLLERRVRELEDENALVRGRERRLAGVLESTPYGVAILDIDGFIIYLNRGVLSLTGYEERTNLLGRRLEELTDAGGRKTLSVGLGAVMAERGYWTGEIAILHQDGTAIPTQISCGRFFDERHRPNDVIVTLRDLSREKSSPRMERRLEDQVVQSQKMEAIGTLAGGVAHDMNNVLTAILNLGAILREEMGADERHRGDVEGILSAAKRGRDLTRNLLAFARKGKYRRERLSLNHVVEEVRGLLAHTAPKTVGFQLVLDESMPPVEGDFGQISQAIMNLCINAIDAMDGEGTITCCTGTVRLEAGELPGWTELPGGEYARLEIIDTGAGMEPDVLERVFEPFFTTKDPQRGTGLGLAMVYGTVKNHGGAVLIDSKRGAGTRATIHLPLARGGELPVRISGIFPTVHAADAAGTILLVDDEEMIRRSVKRALVRLGYEVVLAGNGLEALELIRSRRRELSLVILDLLMPVMGGEEAFHKIRALDPDLPILIASGYAEEEKVEALLAAGARGFVEKPFDLARISEEVKLAARVL
ncbi:MAG: response regulator [Proteobacteria bacterium]|nr:response regulator [Pseudomonadota bacterium]